MTIPKNSRFTGTGRRNDVRQVFATDVTKVPQSVNFIRSSSLVKTGKPKDGLEVTKDLSKHPSFIKFTEQKHDSLKLIADNYKTETSKLMQAQLAYMI